MYILSMFVKVVQILWMSPGLRLGARSEMRSYLSFASPGLLAYLFTSEFEDHLPFYRMERIFSRLKVTLPRASMCNWAIQVGNRLEVRLPPKVYTHFFMPPPPVAVISIRLAPLPSESLRSWNKPAHIIIYSFAPYWIKSFLIRYLLWRATHLDAASAFAFGELTLMEQACPYHHLLLAPYWINSFLISSWYSGFVFNSNKSNPE